jgi:hypothetical protein
VSRFGCLSLEAEIYLKILSGKECFGFWVLSAGKSANHGCQQVCHKADMAVRICTGFRPISFPILQITDVYRLKLCINPRIYGLYS